MLRPSLGSLFCLGLEMAKVLRVLFGLYLDRSLKLVPHVMLVLVGLPRGLVAPCIFTTDVTIGLHKADLVGLVVDMPRERIRAASQTVCLCDPLWRAPFVMGSSNVMSLHHVMILGGLIRVAPSISWMPFWAEIPVLHWVVARASALVSMEIMHGVGMTKPDPCIPQTISHDWQTADLGVLYVLAPRNAARGLRPLSDPSTCIPMSEPHMGF
jgi:hypothetical protein